MERRVAKVKVTVSDIPEEVQNIYMRVAGTPTNVTITGTKQGTKSDVGAEMNFKRNM